MKTMHDGLDAKSDEELNALFAVEVDGLVRSGSNFRSPKGAQTIAFTSADMLEYCTEVNEVLPHLERHQWQLTRWGGLKEGEPTTELTYWINVPMGAADSAEGEAPTLARAAVIALLRYHRAKKPTAP